MRRTATEFRIPRVLLGAEFCAARPPAASVRGREDRWQKSIAISMRRNSTSVRVPWDIDILDRLKVAVRDASVGIAVCRCTVGAAHAPTSAEGDCGPGVGFAFQRRASDKSGGRA